MVMPQKGSPSGAFWSESASARERGRESEPMRAWGGARVGETENENQNLLQHTQETAIFVALNPLPARSARPGKKNCMLDTHARKCGTARAERRQQAEKGSEGE